MQQRFDRLYPYLLIAPATLLLFAVLVYPLGYSVWLSTTNWSMLTFKNNLQFIGLENYRELLTNPDFWNSFRVTLTFMVAAISLELVLGVALALVLHQNLYGKRVFRSLILLPFMATNVVIGLGWRMLYNYDAGIINWFIEVAGLDPVTWISAPETALLSLVIVDVWNTTAFVVLIALAGLQSLPDSPIESAVIDGASGPQIFWHIMLPLLRANFVVILVWRSIDTFRIFDVVYSLTAGGPARSTETLSIFAYRNGFQVFELGFAAATSLFMVVFMIVVSFGLLRFVGRGDESIY